MDLYEKRVLKLREHVLSHEKADEDTPTEEVSKDLKAAEIKALLDEQGIEYDKKAKKDELLALLNQSEDEEVIEEIEE